ncbi:hypothetical protein SRHO_G00039730 [Serrasalmus rhombeus]
MVSSVSQLCLLVPPEPRRCLSAAAWPLEEEPSSCELLLEALHELKEQPGEPRSLFLPFSLLSLHFVELGWAAEESGELTR